MQMLNVLPAKARVAHQALRLSIRETRYLPYTLEFVRPLDP